jgi:hypothetical protein
MYFQWASIGSQTMDGVNYNTDFALPTSVTYEDYAFSLLHGDIEAGLEKAIQRPISHAREQFEYRRPTSLLGNPDLQELGDLMDQYDVTVGPITYTYKEYEVPYWVPFSDNPSPTVTRRIRVITEAANGNEVDRYLFIIGVPYNTSTALQSNNIELSEGDEIEWTFDYRTGNSEPGSVTTIFYVWFNYTIGSELRINNFGEWVTPPTFNGFGYNVPSGDNVQEWHNVTIKSKPVPQNGILRLFLTSASSNNAINETHYRNFRLNINSTENYRDVKGHVHRDNNNITIKNNTDININIDDSISSSIAGTLFEYDSTGIVRNRTSTWTYSIFGESGKLGYLTTLEQMVMMYKPRSLYYGNILKIWHGTEDNIRFISNFFIFNLLNSSDARRFVPGSLSIDYKHNSADITLHEINAGDLPEDAEDYYTFNYIYDNG